MSASMSSSWPRSAVVQKLIATPTAPARAVRPIRWT
jgi:hypothetical protein